MRYDTETNCHCSAAYEGSDHCPECGCEHAGGAGDCGMAEVRPHYVNEGQFIELNSTWYEVIRAYRTDWVEDIQTLEVKAPNGKTVEAYLPLDQKVRVYG